MKDFRSRKNKHNFFTSNFYFFLLFVLLLLLIRAAVSAFHKKNIAIEQETLLQERYDDALAKKQKYLEDLERIESDRGKEEELRTRFDVVGKGETVIKVIQ